MSDFTGDGQDGTAPAPQVIKLGTVARASTASAPASPTSTGHDPFAPSRYRLTRRRVIAFGVVAVLAIGGWAGYQRGSQWWDHRAEVRLLATHDEAAAHATALLSDFRFPVSIKPLTDGAPCALGGRACGTSGAAPEATLTVVAPTLTALGFGLVEDSTDRCTPRGQRFERCDRQLVLEGVQVGSLTVYRDNFTAAMFGSPTQVAIHLTGLSTDHWFEGPPVAISVASPAKLNLMPTDLAALARCTKKSNDGCLEFTVRTTVAGSTRSAFAQVGRYAVAHGWEASGTCPGGASGRCELMASRRSSGGTNAVDRVGILGTFDPAAGGTRVVLTVDADRSPTS